MDSIKIMEETNSNPMSRAHRNTKQMGSSLVVSCVSGKKKSNSPHTKRMGGFEADFLIKD